MMRETFKNKGAEYWRQFGKEEGFDLTAGFYSDFVSPETYRNFFYNKNLSGKRVLDIGAGYPAHSPHLTRPKPDLASPLQEVLIEKEATIIPIDIAEEPLKKQRRVGREGAQGDMFQLPIRDGSIEGGAILINVLNASFSDGEKEVFMNQGEVSQILQEVYRVLKTEACLVVSNAGSAVFNFPGGMRWPMEENMPITIEVVKQIAESVGFKYIQSVPFDEQRVIEGEGAVKSNISAQLPTDIISLLEGGVITYHLIGGGAFVMEK